MASSSLPLFLSSSGARPTRRETDFTLHAPSLFYKPLLWCSSLTLTISTLRLSSPSMMYFQILNFCSLFTNVFSFFSAFQTPLLSSLNWPQMGFSLLPFFHHSSPLPPLKCTVNLFCMFFQKVVLVFLYPLSLSLLTSAGLSPALSPAYCVLGRILCDVHHSFFLSPLSLPPSLSLSLSLQSS